MDEMEKIALGYLPARLGEAVRRCAGQDKIAEIRLRAGGLLTLTVGGTNRSSGVWCTSSDVAETVENLCGGSLYAYAESIRDGVITTEAGIRAGVAGRAVLEDGKITAVRDVSSVNLRIPHRIPGAADAILNPVRRGESLLLCSPPGLGKTTALRELIVRLTSANELRRVAVIDTRYELGAGVRDAVTADFYRGWPRAEGMEAAVRTMAPEILVCDEIAGEEDCAALRNVRAAGITVAVSAHAGNENALRRNRAIAGLLDEGIFDCLAFLGADRRIEVRRLA